MMTTAASSGRSWTTAARSATGELVLLLRFPFTRLLWQGTNQQPQQGACGQSLCISQHKLHSILRRCPSRVVIQPLSHHASHLPCPCSHKPDLPRRSERLLALHAALHLCPNSMPSAQCSKRTSAHCSKHNSNLKHSAPCPSAAAMKPTCSAGLSGCCPTCASASTPTRCVPQGRASRACPLCPSASMWPRLSSLLCIPPSLAPSGGRPYSRPAATHAPRASAGPPAQQRGAGDAD